MQPTASLITAIAAALGLALVLGFVAVPLRLPTLVGFLAASILLGTATPGFVADVALAMQLAEIGVMLLMFGVGLHFFVNDLLEVKSIAMPGAMIQIGIARAQSRYCHRRAHAQRRRSGSAAREERRQGLLHG